MSVIFNVIFVSRCSSTHHKLAMDALRHVRGEDAERWRRLFLKHHPSYLEGSKAPDDRFKDFKNHVLHVGDGEWGGAIKAVETWYDRFVHALRKQDWEEAAFSAGVLSHYYTDPIQPFHTGQSEAEGKVHRAAEWSIAKSYHELQNILEQDFDGYPSMELPTTPTWLADHVRNGARMAHQYYDTCIEHYDLAKGVRNPPAGLDQELKDILAQLIGFAAVGFARVLERGFDESQAQAPEVELLLDTIIAQCRRPVNWIVRQLKDVHERNIVMDIYREVQNTGKAIETLPPDDRAVRRLHAQEVRKIPLGELDAEPAKAAGTAHGTGEPPRSRSREAITRMARGSRFRFSRAPKVAASAEVTAVPVPQTAAFHSSAATRVQSAAPVQSTAAAHVASYQTAPRVSGGQATMATPPVVAANRDQELRRDVLSARAAVAPPSTLSSTTIVTERTPAVVPALGPIDERDSYRASESLPVLLDRDAARDSFAGLRDSVDRRASGEVEPARFARTSPVETVVTQVQEDRPVATAWSSSNEADAGRLRLERERAERDRMDRERAERERSERDRMDRERRERDRLEAQQREQETRDRLERDRFERDRIERERQERERLERERVDRDLREPADRVRLAESSEPSPRVASPAARSARFYLETTSDIEQAPSIGGKTADRLRGVGLRTVRHLLDCQPEKTAAKINQRWITAEVIRQWQQQASLVCRIPDLRGHDAQILVGCGITDPDDLAQRGPVPLKAAVDAFCATTAGERILRGSAAPDDAEIREWIEAAGRSRGLQAA